MGLEELLPELLCLGLLAIDPLAFVPVALDRPCVEVGPLGGVDGGVFDVRYKCANWDRRCPCRFRNGSGRKWGADHCVDRHGFHKDGLCR